jgi:hypothetical protein
VRLAPEDRESIIQEVLESVDGERLRIYGDLARELGDPKVVLQGLHVQLKNTVAAVTAKEQELRDLVSRAERTRVAAGGKSGGVFRPPGGR